MKPIITSLLICVTFLFIHCDETSSGIPDLSNQEINMYQPYDYSQLTNTLVEFAWENASNVSYYRLLVSSVDSNNSESIILDTSLTSNNFKKILVPGTYFWSVQGANYYSTTTGVSNYVFTIDTTNYQFESWDTSVRILAPSDSSVYLSEREIILWWELLEGAAGYEVMTITPNFTDPEKIIMDEVYGRTEEKIQNLMLDSAKYQWRLRAFKYANNDQKIYTEYAIRSLIVQ
jgi:hypothetical protein